MKQLTRSQTSIHQRSIVNLDNIWRHFYTTFIIIIIINLNHYFCLQHHGKHYRGRTMSSSGRLDTPYESVHGDNISMAQSYIIVFPLQTAFGKTKEISNVGKTCLLRAQFYPHIRWVCKRRFSFYKQWLSKLSRCEQSCPIENKHILKTYATYLLFGRHTTFWPKYGHIMTVLLAIDIVGRYNAISRSH